MSEPMQLHSAPSPLRPNWQLKVAREQRGWSQQDLAEHLNITANSVSRWERGISSPGPYFRRQLCDLFGMSLAELGLAGRSKASVERVVQADHATSLSLPVIWNVPFQRNPFFTGREEELMQLHEQLRAGGRSTGVPQALCGLAGIGKTQTAVEYCHRFSKEYQAILWVRAETHETLIADVVALAALLDLPEREGRDQQRVAEAVKGWLRAHRNWLLVLDNIEDLALLQQVVPPIHQGHILLTMRAQATGTLAQRLDLEKMDAQEAALFLLRRTKSIPCDAEVDDAAPTAYASALEIARLLDGLPLALDQAGAYIEETGCSFTDYIERYRSERATLLRQRGGVVSDHPASVAAMFSLIIERVEALNPAAADLLRLCAFLQPDAIPEDMIFEGISEGGSILEPLARDAYAFDAAIKTLRDFFLIQRHPESKTLSLHRLVQAVIQDRMDEPARRQWTEWTVQLVSRAFPDPEDDTSWQRCQRYLPQALACVALIDQWEIVTHEAGVQLLRVGIHLQNRSEYAHAERLLLRARDILLHTAGEMHPDYANCLNELALLYHYQGKYEQAEPLYRQSLLIREQILGTEHVDFAESLGNLGALFYCQGKYAQAEPVMLRALAIREKQLGTEHLQVIEVLDSIGDLYMFRGKYAQAEPIMLRALAVREKRLGPEHPLTLLSLSYVASLYAAKKQYQRAESLHQQVLAMREKQLGAEHYHVGTSLHHLGRVYHEQGQYERAEELYRRSLDILERALGPKHLLTARTLDELARLYLNQGQIDRAEPLCQRALNIREQELGSGHPHYADSLATLAQLCEHRGENEKAMQLYRQALDICKDELVPSHPLVIRCQAACSRLRAKETGEQPSFPDYQAAAASLPEATLEQTAGTEQVRAVQTALDDFLAACCELHPRACCRASNLWDAYQRWSEEQGERFPLSRRAFAEALKQRGCSPDRTNEYRTWRGVALRDNSPASVTPGDVM